MASKKISDLGLVGTLSASDLLEIETAGGESKHVLAGTIAALVTGSVTQVACSDETTALTSGTGKATFRVVGARSLIGVRGSLSTEQTSGALVTVDVNKNGTTVLSTKLTFDNAEKTTTTAATAAVISVPSFADDDEVSIDIDGVGDGTAKGLKVSLLWG